MSIDRGVSLDGDDDNERQARLDWMIDEFRQAQTRRRVKATDKPADSQDAPVSKAAVTGTAPSQ